MALFRVSNERAQFDAAGNDARDQYGAGIRFTQGGNARVTTGSATNYNQGIPMSATGQVAIVDATAGLPADTIFHNGLPISGDKVCVSRNATAVVSNGLPFDSAGAVAADINLDLNFVGATSMNSSVTFTRASSATFVGSNGLIQSATTNTPRFDYDPITLAAKGLLIEEQRANLFIRSDDFSAWAQLNVTVTADTTVSPDGTSNADTIALNAGTATKYVGLAATGATVPCVMTVYAKVGTHSFIQLMNTGDSSAFANFDISTGVVGTKGGKVTSSIAAAGNGWYRCVAAFDATVTSTTTFRVYGIETASSSYGGNTTSTGNFFLWGAQLEAGAFPTSYIPTVASQVTRSDDRAVVNTLSPWYNATEGTLYAEGSALAVSQSSDRTLVSLSTGTAANTVEIYKGASTSNAVFYITNSSVLQAGLSIASTFLADVPAKSAGAYKTDDIAFATKGATPLTDSLAVIPTMDRLGIGSRGSGSPSSVIWNGHIRRITYYPRRLSNAELQAITA